MKIKMGYFYNLPQKCKKDAYRYLGLVWAVWNSAMRIPFKVLMPKHKFGEFLTLKKNN